MNIGFTKFTQVRPLNVLSMSHQDQGVCCCPYCENMKLVMKVPWLNPDCLKRIIEFIKLLHCDIDNVDCMNGHCQLCSSRDNKKTMLNGLKRVLSSISRMSAHVYYVNNQKKCCVKSWKTWISRVAYYRKFPYST
jgi:hypothetical protein